MAPPIRWRQNPILRHKEHSYSQTDCFVGIAALATVTYAGVTGWQLYLMKGQLRALLESNEINREALYSVQRAFVASQKYTSELATFTNIDKTGKPVTVIETTAHWENIGNTPAIDARLMFGSLSQRRIPGTHAGSRQV